MTRSEGATGRRLAPGAKREPCPPSESELMAQHDQRWPYGFLVALAVGLSVAAVIVAAAYDLPLRDPDEVAGPSYLRLPIIVALGVLTDVLPRCVVRSSGLRSLPATLAIVLRERWHGQRVRLVGIGLASWYVIYVAFRNLKSFVPFVREGTADASLGRLDKILVLGHDPATLLHDLLGTGVAAHVMSAVYIGWIVFVPASLAAALVWTRNVSRGFWYVTAIGVDWVLGVATYYLIPSVGPVYAHPSVFADLSVTASSRLEQTMIADRADVVADPYATQAVQTIAAFASLHVAILFTAVLIASRVGLHRWVVLALRVFLVLTVLSTVYLGWHYLVDVIGGFAIGAAAMWVGAITTGNDVRPAQHAEVLPGQSDTASAAGA